MYCLNWPAGVSFVLNSFGRDSQPWIRAFIIDALNFLIGESRMQCTNGINVIQGFLKFWKLANSVPAVKQSRPALKPTVTILL